jgi:hypothetical protein
VAAAGRLGAVAAEEVCVGAVAVEGGVVVGWRSWSSKWCRGSADGEVVVCWLWVE